MADPSRGQIPQGGARVRRRRHERAEALSLLELTTEANTADIKAAYRRLMLIHHPDHGGSARRAARLNLAKETLLAH